MSTNNFREKLLENWKAKIGCFVLAIFIFFFHKISSLDKKTYVLPLTVVANGKMTTVEDFSNNYVKVIVRGKAEQLVNITESDIEAYIDISSVTEEGKYQMPVLIKPSEKLSLIEPLELSTSPENVYATLEENVFRYVPVAVTFAGEVPYGYQVSSVSAEPSYVRVTGARSMVESVTSIQTDGVDISNLTENLDTTVKLVNSNKMINVDTYSPVDVKVEVSSLVEKKQLTGIDIVYSNLSKDVDVISPRASLDVEIEGSVLVLDNITQKNIIASADCSSISYGGNYTVPVYIIAPSSVKVVNQSMSSVNITSILRKEEVEEEISVIEDNLDE